MQNKSVILCFFICATLVNLYAQDDFSRTDPIKPKSSFMDKIQLGGGAGMQFGNQTVIEISPKLAYHLTNKMNLGVGLTYSFYRINLDRMYGHGGLYQTSIYGGSAFANYMLFSNLFAHLEYELLNFEQYDNLAQEFNRKWLGSFFVGGGYRQYFNNDKSYLQIVLLYNLNYQTNSPYSSPLVPRVQIYF